MSKSLKKSVRSLLHQLHASATKDTQSTKTHVEQVSPVSTDPITLSWMDLQKRAIEKQEQSGIVLWRGCIGRESRDVVSAQWWIHAHHLNVIAFHPSHSSGAASHRIEKTRIEFTDIDTLSWHPDNSNADMFNGTLEPISIRQSMVFQADADRTVPGCLYLVYRDKSANTTRPLYLPDFGTLADFADLQLLLPVKKEMTDMGIVWQARPYLSDVLNTWACWLATSECIWIAECGKVSHSIPLRHVCDFTMDSEKRYATVKYLTASKTSTTMEIIEVSVELLDTKAASCQEFINSFTNLGIMWRQQVQMQMIELAFSDKENLCVNETLSKHVLDRCSTENLSSKEFKKLPSSLNRADSMRRVFKPRSEKSHSVRSSRLTESTLPIMSPEKDLSIEVFEPDSSVPSLQESSTVLSLPNTPTPEITQDPAHIRSAETNGNVSPFSMTTSVHRRHTITGSTLLSTHELVQNYAALQDSLRKLSLKKPDVYYCAVYDYETVARGELRFSVGDVLKVFKKDGSGWWFAVKLEWRNEVHETTGDQDEVGKKWTAAGEGWVPSNYLEPVLAGSD